MSVEKIIQENIDNPADNPKEDQKVDVTQKNILIAVELIEKLGKKPTQSAVRLALGGGSFTTIAPILKNIKLNKSQEHELEEVDIPEPVEDRAKQLLGEVWQSAISEAENKLQLQREELRMAQEEAQQEVEDSREAIKILESEAESKGRNIKEKDGLISELNTTLKNKEDEFNKSEGEKKECMINLANKSESILKTEGYLKKSQEDFDAERRDNKKLNSEKADNLKEISRLKPFETNFLEEQNKNKLLVSENSGHLKEIERLKSFETQFKETVELNKTLTKANTDLDRENKKLDRQQQKNQRALDLSVNAHNDLKEKEKELRKSFDAEIKQNGVLSGRLEITMKENKGLKAMVKELEEKLSSVKK